MVGPETEFFIHGIAEAYSQAGVSSRLQTKVLQRQLLSFFACDAVEPAHGHQGNLGRSHQDTNFPQRYRAPWLAQCSFDIILPLTFDSTWCETCIIWSMRLRAILAEANIVLSESKQATKPPNSGASLIPVRKDIGADVLDTC